MYCPFSSVPLGEDDASISIDENRSYSVSVLNNAVTNSRDYVSGSPQPPVQDVLALLISLERSAVIPDCRDVVVSANGRYVLGGDSAAAGRVYTLTTHDVQVSGKVNVEFVDASETNSLNIALTEVSNKPTEDHVLVLTGGQTYYLSRNLTFEPSYLGKQGSVVIRGENSSLLSNIVTEGGSPVSLKFGGMDVIFENISLSNAVFLEFEDSDVKMRRLSGGVTSVASSEVYFDNVGFNGNTLSRTALSIVNSNVNVKGGLSVTSDSNPVAYVEDSTIVTTDLLFNLGLGDSSIGVQMLNSEWSSRATNVNYSVDSGDTAQTVVYVDALSKLAWSGGDIYGSGGLVYGAFVEGESVVQNADFMFDSGTSVAFSIASGAKANLSTMTLGDSSSNAIIGIADAGGMSVRGDVTIYASTCFAGDGFSRSLDTTVQDDTVTQVNPDFSIIVGTVIRNVNLEVTAEFNTLGTTCL